MLSKIWAIAYKEVYMTFTDRNAVLILIVTPLALATIIGTAFSSFIGGGNDVPVENIPVAIVNLDAGAEANGTQINNGEIFASLLVPPDDQADEGNPLHSLTDAVRLTGVDEAKAAVDRGEYAAVIIIPADFSEKLTYSQDHGIEPVAVELYSSASTPIYASILQSITESITNQIATGSITIQATIEALIELAQRDPAFGIRFVAASAAGTFQPDFAPAYTPGENPITITQQTVTGQAAGFNPLVTFGAAQAVFFMMFTAIASTNSLLEERRDGTLQRLLVTPTPRIAILLGKLLGSLATCIVQVTILLVALTIVGSVLSGEVQFIWGNDLLALAAVVFSVSLAACGLGTILAAVVSTPEQGNAIGGIISLAMGVLGGAFVTVAAFPPFIQSLSRLTINFWGTDAFVKLSQNQPGVGTNVLALLSIGIVLFGIGLAIFNRRLSV